MFSDKIAPIQPLSTDTLDISRPRYEPDYALSCLHYAMMKPRFGAKKLIGEFDEVPAHILENIVKSFDDTRPEDAVSFCWYYVINMADSDIEHFIEKLNYTRLTLLEKFVSDKTNQRVLIYHNIERNTAYVFSENKISLAVYHLVLSFYSILYPGLFTDPCTPDEIEAMKSLTYKNSGPFIAAVANLLRPYEKDMLRERLESCFGGFRQAKLDMAERKVNNTRQQMATIMSQYNDYARQLEADIIAYEGLRCVTSSSEEETNNLIDYIASSNNLMNVNYQNGFLTFDVKTLLINIDPDKWRNAVQREAIYDYYTIPQESVFSVKANRKCLLDAIFGNVDPDLYVKVWGRITLGISGGCSMTPSKAIDMSHDPILKDYLMNPHFAKHACPGQNRGQIVECLQRYDLISAMECSIAATGSVNIAETGLTFRPFVNWILTSRNKIIHNRQTEKDMTPEEALLWLMEKEKKNAANQND